MRHLALSCERRKRERTRSARAAFVLGVVAAASCSVYDQELIDNATGVAASPGSGGSGRGGAGGQMGGAGAGGSAGKGQAGTSGSGGATGGAAGSGAGKAGSGGASGGKAGGGGKAGSGGASAGSAGTVTDGGEGGQGTDLCPDDDTKTEPGDCGCGVPESETDTDGDTALDCVETCDEDETRTAPGACGACGVPYSDADCTTLETTLVNRYSFNGTGDVIEDSVGDADGTLVQMATGATQSDGVVTLTGGITLANDTNRAHVALPGGCLNGLTSATFEAFVSWSTTCPANCTNNWQRIFDFGSASAGTSGSNIFLTPRANLTGTPVMSASTTMGNTNELETGHRVDGTTIAAGDYHFAVVIDAVNSQVSLYVNGVRATGVNIATNPAPYAGTLASIDDTNCWLGRSNYSGDAYYNGTLDEFRIYNTALSETAIQASYTAGPNPDFL